MDCFLWIEVVADAVYVSRSLERALGQHVLGVGGI
jgi:hypothetical protein